MFYTADDFWEMSHRDEDDNLPKRYELDEGELIEMSPTGDIHGLLTLWLGYLILGFVIQHDLGEVTGAETGYILFKDPKTGRDTVRAPDVGFIAKSRLQPLTGKFYRIAPDFAVEVVSPTDTAKQMRRKAEQYLRAGTRLVWIIYPDDRLVDVYRPDHDVKTLRLDNTLDGADVLPGFTLIVKDIFNRIRE